jgi:hypothetical protein
MALMTQIDKWLDRMHESHLVKPIREENMITTFKSACGSSHPIYALMEQKMPDDPTEQTI